MQEIPYLSHLTWPNHGAKSTPGSVVLREARGDAGERRSRDWRHARRGDERQWRGGGADRYRRGDTLARLIGRRIAREELERLDAANDNAPAKNSGERQES